MFTISGSPGGAGVVRLLPRFRVHSWLVHAVVALAFALAAAGTIAAPAPWAGWCKPTLMPILLAWFHVAVGPDAGRFGVLVRVALVFSWLGDVALQRDGDGWFAAGLAAFLVAQLTYAAAFAGQAGWGRRRLPAIAFALATTVIATGTLVGRTVVGHAPRGLAIPVGLYAAAITAMGTGAALRLGATPLASFALVFVGAEWFVISDSILAANRFVEPLPHARWSVMLTYTLGQFLIVAGCVRHCVGRGPRPSDGAEA